MARIVELIETEITKGDGSYNDPTRTVTQYWSKDGELIFEKDNSIQVKISSKRKPIINNPDVLVFKHSDIDKPLK